MFDFGLDPLGVMNNMELLNIDVAETEIIWNTIADIEAMNPDIIAPAHCTGFEALVAFSSSLPDAFTLNTVGTEYTFEA
jgi:7,8-dihydropterin-6-yl-methyl-4-(beta-D-ribofuranosyl)aminobenzene 5'-phosphate synthase